jgi:hypothetical protein
VIHTSIPLFDYGLWALVILAELICLWRLRGPQRLSSVRAVRVFLWIQIVSAVPMLAISIWLPTRIYYLAYLADSLLEYAAEIQIIISLLLDFKGKATVWGSVRSWILATAIIGSVLGFFGAFRIHEGVPAWLAVIQAMSQVSGFVRIVVLVGVVFFSILMASAWIRSVAFVWGGLAIYILSDFSITELTIYRPDLGIYLKHGPDVAFFITLFFWSVAVGERSRAKAARKARLNLAELGLEVRE